MLGSSWAAAQLAASQEGLSSMSEWVSEWVSPRYSVRNGVFHWEFLNKNSVFMYCFPRACNISCSYYSSWFEPLLIIKISYITSFITANITYTIRQLKVVDIFQQSTSAFLPNAFYSVLYIVCCTFWPTADKELLQNNPSTDAGITLHMFLNYFVLHFDTFNISRNYNK
jgi:hypothetical protein